MATATAASTTHKGNHSRPRPPRLFLLGELEGETKHALFDPLQKAFTIFEFPELCSQTVCVSSGHGWLLLLSRETSSLFFFNPITRQKIDLPYRSSIFTFAVFTAPPTSHNCVLFVLERTSLPFGKFHIDALFVGLERVWIRYAFRVRSNEFDSLKQAVFCNGFLYCVDFCGKVGRFDIKHGDWKIVPMEKMFKRLCLSYSVEYKGEIFAGKKGQNGDIEKIYKLKFEGEFASWEEVKDIGNVAIFFSSYGSCVIPGSNKDLQNKVYVARDDPLSKCVMFDADDGDYKMRKKYDATPFSWWYLPVWIERSSLAFFD